jgi:hypothetical protein
MTIEATNRREYIRKSVTYVFSTISDLVTDLTVVENENPQVRYPKGAHRLGGEDFLPIPTESKRRGERGIAHFLVAIDIECGPNDVIDDVADEVVQAVEIALKNAKPPDPFENDTSKVEIDEFNRATVIPNLDRDGKSGKIYLPVIVSFTQWWKR